MNPWVYRVTYSVGMINVGSWWAAYINVWWVTIGSVSISAWNSWGGTFHVPAASWQIIEMFVRLISWTSSGSLNTFTVQSDKY